MSRVPRRWLLIGPSACVVLLVFGAIVVSRYQDYRINKINSIISDNQHENVASFSREHFTAYLAACGARVDSSAPQWTVHYDGLLEHRAWSFPFVAPTSNSQ
jgi:hypothetical protein